MNPFTLLKQDHKKVKELFQKFEKAGENAVKTKESIARQVFRELEIHTTIEEEILYPAIKAAAEEKGQELVAEAYEEHHVAKTLIEELEAIGEVSDERFEAKFKVLQENVEHHVEEEESELFPEAKECLDDAEEIGDRMEARKKELEASIKEDASFGKGSREKDELRSHV